MVRNGIVRAALTVGCILSCSGGCQLQDRKAPGSAVGGQKWQQAQRSKKSSAEETQEPAIKPVTHFAAGQLFEEQGQLGQALLQYQKALQLNNQFVMAYNRIGICYDKLKRQPEAEQVYRKAITLRPDAAFLRNNLAFNLMAQRRFDEAEGILQEVLREHPTYKRARSNLAIILAQRQMYDDALEQFKQALGEPRAYYNLGLIYQAREKKKEAIEAFEKSLALEPRLIYAQRHLKELRRELSSLDGQTKRFAFHDPDQEGTPAPTTPVEPARIAQANVTAGERAATVPPLVEAFALADPARPTPAQSVDLDDDLPLIIEQRPCEVVDRDGTVANLRQQMRNCTTGRYADLYLLAGQSSADEEFAVMDASVLSGFVALAERFSNALGDTSRQSLQVWYGHQRQWARELGPSSNGAGLEELRSGVERVWSRYLAALRSQSRRGRVPPSDAIHEPEAIGRSQDTAAMPLDRHLVTLEDIEHYLTSISKTLPQDWEKVSARHTAEN